MTTTRRQLLTASLECGTGEFLTPTSINEVDLDVRCGFPDIIAETHTGETIRFYEERIMGKVFVMHFFSIEDDVHHGQIAALRKVAGLLGTKVGREVHFTSISVDPEKDTVERLAAFAKEHDLPEGWLMIRARSEDSAVLAQRMYHFNRGASVGMGRIAFYGNGIGKARVWGTFPVKVTPEDAAHRIGWVMPRERPAQLRRAGPSKPDQAVYAWSHRAYA